LLMTELVNPPRLNRNAFEYHLLKTNEKLNR
jgi:hypothetical protein